MNRKTRKALLDSIEHWRSNAEDDFMDAGIGTKECALCGLFFKSNNTCTGCPIREATGLSFCRNTPYDKAYEHFDIAHLLKMSAEEKLEPWDDETIQAVKDFRKAAKEEEMFLRALVPAQEGEDK